MLTPHSWHGEDVLPHDIGLVCSQEPEARKDAAVSSWRFQSIFDSFTEVHGSPTNQCFGTSARGCYTNAATH